MLSDRQKKILKLIIEEYVKTAEPVGSKFLAQLPDLNLSSATIRNEMASLEKMGLLLKTHTSSGRVPSEEGYKVYVRSLIESEQKAENFPLLDEIFKRDMITTEQAIKESMSLVSELTNYASLILGGNSYKSKIKKLQFVPINQSLGVILMVTDQGYVESKKIIIPDEIDAGDIEKVVNFLNDTLYDCPISEIDYALHEKVDNEQIRMQMEYYDELIGIFVRAFASMAQDRLFLSGKTNILNQPEFKDINKAKSLIEAIEKNEVLKVIDLNEKGITVKIGAETEIKAMRDCTIISLPFENDNGERGAIAVIGPKRMEYQKVIPLLKYISKNLRKL